MKIYVGNNSKNQKIVSKNEKVLMDIIIKGNHCNITSENYYELKSISVRYIFTALFGASTTVKVACVVKVVVFFVD